MSWPRLSLSEFRQCVKYSANGRKTGFNYFVNHDIADAIVTKLGLEKYREAIVQDGNPGVNALSIALHNRVRPRTHLVLERKDALISQWKSKAFQDSSISPQKMSGTYFWRPEQLSQMQDVFIPPPLPKGTEFSSLDVSPNALVVTNCEMSGASADQYVQHTVNMIGFREYLQATGRVKILVWVPEKTAARLLQPPGTSKCSKLPLELHAIADLRVLVGVEGMKLSSSQVDAAAPVVAMAKPTDFIYPATPMLLLEITPKAIDLYKHGFDFDTFDYVMRNMNVAKASRVRNNIVMLGSGAENLVPLLEGLIDVDKLVWEMTLSDWFTLARIFHSWPFRPRLLADVTCEADESHESLNNSLYRATGFGAF